MEASGAAAAHQSNLCSASAHCFFLCLGTFPRSLCGINGTTYPAGKQTSPSSTITAEDSVAVGLIRTVSYGCSIYKPQSADTAAQLFISGGERAACGQQAISKRSEVYQIHNSLHQSTHVLLHNDFCSAKTQFSTPPSSCSSMAVRKRLQSLFGGYKQLNAAVLI